MKLRISSGAVRAFASLAILSRVVCGVIVDMPELLNAGWISVLLGGLLALPLAFAVRSYRMLRCAPPRAICFGFFIVALCDAAALSSAIADSAGYMALNSTAAIYLTLPQLILCLFCLSLNGDSLGSSAGLWNKLLPWLLAIVAVLQANGYHAEWLTPLLAPGVPALIQGAFRVAGWLSLPIALYAVAEPGIEGKAAPLHTIRTLCIATGGAALICMLFSLNIPITTNSRFFTRTFRLDALLANSRSELALQLPSIALWYVGMFYALLFLAFTASLMLQRALIRWDHRACVLVTLILIGILGGGWLSGRHAALDIADWLYPAQAALLAIAMLIPIFQRKGVPPHA